VVEVGKIPVPVAHIEAAESMQGGVHSDGGEREVAFAVAPEMFHGGILPSKPFEI
jgi:hypothetical protein